MKRFHLLLALFLWGSSLYAQRALPFSFSQAFKNLYSDKALPSPNTITIPPKTLAKHQEKFDGSPIISLPVNIQFSLRSAGKWFKLANGGQIWQLTLGTPNAQALALFLDNIQLPSGSYLYFFDASHQMVKGPFSQKDISPNGRLFSGLINGNQVTIEYFEPANVLGKGSFNVFRMDHVYQTSSSLSDPRFNTSLSCHTNINCESDGNFQNERSGICRIVMILEEGIGYCTGNLMNNTAQDRTPYILTGFHCQDGFNPLYDLWRFDFNFETSTCETPLTTPDFQSITGCTQRAGRQESDMLLLEISTPIPNNIEAFYLGWDRAVAGPLMSTNIHHPLGDVKKITHFSRPATIFNGEIDWSNEVRTPANQHFRVDYDTGAFEPGSSGSALLNQENRVVGHLHGGNATCEESLGYYGRFHIDWSTGETPDTRLKDWLDPLNLDPNFLDGFSTDPAEGGQISGTIRMEDSRGIPNITVQLVGTYGASTTTDSMGNFSFENVPFGPEYQISLVKTGDVSNGVSLSDLIKIQKHILRSEIIDSPYQMIAADADGSGFISLADIITLQRIILRREKNFTNVESWQFLPSAFSFTNPNDPFTEERPNFFVIPDFQTSLGEVNFVGLKTGDVTGDVMMN